MEEPVPLPQASPRQGDALDSKLTDTTSVLSTSDGLISFALPLSAKRIAHSVFRKRHRDHVPAAHRESPRSVRKPRKRDSQSG
jgi:hypothetical protein